MQVKNEAMLITYADSLGNNLKDLKTVLEKHMKGVIGGVHILPFSRLPATAVSPRWITPKSIPHSAAGQR